MKDQKCTCSRKTLVKFDYPTRIPHHKNCEITKLINKITPYLKDKFETT